MTTKERVLTTSIIENFIQNALSNADVSSQLKATILGDIQAQIEASKPSVDNTNVVAIPSLGEFGELLDIVSPRSSNGVFWKQEDLILLNMGRNITILFYDHDYLKHQKPTSQATEVTATTEAREAKEKEKEKDKKEEKEEIDSEQDKADNKAKILLSKVVFEKQETYINGGTMSRKDRSTLTMNSIDEFSCLLLGCCIALSNINVSSRSTFEDTMFSNVEKYLGKAYSDNDILYARKEMKTILPLLNPFFF